VRGVGLKTIRLSIEAAAGRQLWLPEWSDKKWLRRAARDYEDLLRPQSIAKYGAMIARHRHDIDTPSTRNCGQLDVINDDLVPFARALSERGVELDVIFPVYSPVLFYEWIDRDERLRVNGPSFMNDQLLMRRCVVEALDSIPGIRVFAFDNVPGLAANLANFRDPGHLYNEAAARYMLRSIATGENRLTRGNIDGQIADMRKRIVKHKIEIGPPWQAPK
jgi:hypothetical protein